MSSIQHRTPTAIAAEQLGQEMPGRRAIVALCWTKPFQPKERTNIANTKSLQHYLGFRIGDEPKESWFT